MFRMILGSDIAASSGEDDERSTVSKDDLGTSGLGSKDDLEGNWTDKDSFERLSLGLTVKRTLLSMKRTDYQIHLTL